MFWNSLTQEANWYSHYRNKNSMEVSHETKNRVATWSGNPISGHITRQNCNSKRYMHPYVQRSTIYRSPDMKQPKSASTDECMKMRLYTTQWKTTQPEKEQHNAICSNMYEPRDYHTEWSKSERQRQIPHDITYMWNVQYYTMNLLTNRNRLTDQENRPVIAKGETE